MTTIASVLDPVGQPLHEVLATPFAVLDGAALEHNLTTMARWCSDHGVELQPHGKTTMAPALYERQLAAGATGITAATPAQVRVMRAHGVPEVQLANELTQPREARWIAEQVAAGFTFTCWVDSPQGVAILDAAAAGTGATLDVLLEVGAVGGRTGCRDAAGQAAVRAAVDAAPNVRLVGVAGYEGAVAGDRSPESMAVVRDYLGRMRAAAAEIAPSLAGPVVLSAGGSMFYDLVAEVLTADWPTGAARVVLRSGCYITHDHGMFHRNSPLDGPDAAIRLHPALTVWGTVVSRPEPARAFLDVGRRDVSFDQGLPVPLRRRAADGVITDFVGATVTALNDQHAFIDLPADLALAIGDRVELGISHPCTTFDKWRHIPVVDETGAVTEVIDTYF